MVPFHGDGAGIAELTWGQREIWAAMRKQRSSLSIGGVTPLPAVKDVDFFVEALRFMMSRHQSLRTRLRFAPDGGVRQVLADHGEIGLYVVEVADDGDPAEVAAEVCADYRARDFDYEHEWPVRMAVIRHHDTATHLVAIYCHLALDAHGLTALIANLADRTESTGTAPLAQAAWQGSPAGQRLNRAAQRHWKRQLDRVPARRFAETDDERQPRHWQVSFRSPAAYLGLRSITARTQTESSPVMLAAVAVALARVTGRNPTVLQVVVNNRFRPGLADTVSCLAQTGLCVIDVADTTFDDAVERARQSTMSTYLNAYYHPDEMTELIAELGRERGEVIELDCYFNDRRVPEHREPTGPIPTPEQLAAVSDETTLSWGPPSDAPFEPFFFHINDVPDTLDLILYTDTRCLPPGDMTAFLHGVESILVAAAFDAAAPTGVAAREVTASPGPVG
jgi:hypothetical protein